MRLDVQNYAPSWRSVRKTHLFIHDKAIITPWAAVLQCCMHGFRTWAARCGGRSFLKDDGRLRYATLRPCQFRSDASLVTSPLGCDVTLEFRRLEFVRTRWRSLESRCSGSALWKDLLLLVLVSHAGWWWPELTSEQNPRRAHVFYNWKLWFVCEVTESCPGLPLQCTINWIP